MSRSRFAAGSRKLAASRGLQFGAKFSNTLEVENHRDFFQPTEKIMYLSGAPLHVITLTLAGEFRKAMGAAFPISFSAGVDRKNFANLVACGIRAGHHVHRPVEDRRLRPVAAVLARSAAADGSRSAREPIDDFILDCRGQREAAGGDPVQAGFLEHADHRRRNAGRPALSGRAESRRAQENRFAPRDVRLHHVRQVHPRLPERRELSRTTPANCG